MYQHGEEENDLVIIDPCESSTLMTGYNILFNYDITEGKNTSSPLATQK